MVRHLEWRCRRVTKKAESENWEAGSGTTAAETKELGSFNGKDHWLSIVY